MTRAEIKENFHKLLNDIDNEEVLEMFYYAMNDFVKDGKRIDILDELSDEQKLRIDSSINQSMTGKTIPHPEALQHVKSWFIK